MRRRQFLALSALAPLAWPVARRCAAAEVDVFDQSDVALEADTDDPKAIRIVLIAGPAGAEKAVGGHEYFAGLALLAGLLKQTPGVHPIMVRDWPKKESLFDKARAVVFYMDGGGKQTTVTTKERLAKMDQLAAAGAGLVHIHQCIDYPGATADKARAWLGGAWVAGHSNAARGHWDSTHDKFPDHAITRGVTPWTLNDGWLAKIKFVDGMKGISPLIWSSKQHSGRDEGGPDAITGWAYERPKPGALGAPGAPGAGTPRLAEGGGRSFVFTGLDAHEAWAKPGVRQLVTNGVLWSAGLDIPKAGAPCELDVKTMNRHFDRRPAKKPAVKKPAAK